MAIAIDTADHAVCTLLQEVFHARHELDAMASALESAKEIVARADAVRGRLNRLIDAVSALTVGGNPTVQEILNAADRVEREREAKEERAACSKCGGTGRLVWQGNDGIPSSCPCPECGDRPF